MLPALAIGLALAAADPCVIRDPAGDFVACFDPGNRIELGAGGAWTGQTGALHFSSALRVRRSRESRTHEHTAWSMEHAFLETVADREPSRWTGTALAYDGLMFRHLDEGFILLPTSTPRRIPFPFDIAVNAQLGGLERDRDEMTRIEVGRAGLLLDAARDPTGRLRLALGPSLSYALERGSAATFSQRVQPLTGGTLLLRWESETGRWAAQGRADGGWELTPGAASSVRIRGAATLERVILAVNDQPISLQLFARDLWRSDVGHDARVGLALVAAYDL